MRWMYLVFMAVFILLGSSALAKDVLFIGDSHVAGTYGKELEQLFRNNGDTVSRYGCVSAKAQDYVTGTFSCAQGSVFQGTQKDYTIPTIKSLLSDVPDIVIISLGGNYPAAPDLSKTLLESGVQDFQCYWVGPAWGPTTSEPTLRNFYSGLSKIAGKCNVIDALSLTDHNFCGNQRFCPDEKRLHFDEYGPEGVQVAKQWAQGVFNQVTEKAITTPAPTSGAAPSLIPLGAVSPSALTSTVPGVENCLDQKRCKEIDEVWLIIVKWINAARKGLIWNTVKNDWTQFQEKLPSITLTPGITGAGIKQSIKSVAEAEWVRWAQGTKTHTDPEMRSALDSYYAAAAGSACPPGSNPNNVPWSASFISYIAKQAGVTDFPVNCAHSGYFNSLRDNPGICRTYPMSEKSRISVGDIVCHCRLTPAEIAAGKTACSNDYNNPSTFGHCDVVVNVLGNNQIEVIGGNVGNTVSKRILDLSTDIVASPNSAVSGDRKWYGFISCEGAGAAPGVQPSENLCVATTGTPEERALLDTIGWAEATGNRYDMVAFGQFVEAHDPSNPYRKEGNLNLFSNYASHPNILIRFKSGECTGRADSSCTTAAGRYQFLYGGYLEIEHNNCDIGCFKGGFNPKEQDEAALRQATILGVTNDVLKNAIATGNFIPVWDKLAPVWASFPSSAHGGEGALGQKGKSAPALQERYIACLQVHQGKIGVSSVSSIPSPDTFIKSSDTITLKSNQWGAFCSAWNDASHSMQCDVSKVSGFEKFTIEKEGGGVVNNGDAITLKSNQWEIFCSAWSDATHSMQCGTSAAQAWEKFTIGKASQIGGGKNCPEGMAKIGNFCIDKFEGTLVDEGGKQLSPYNNPGFSGAASFKAVSVGDVVPQAYITGEQAALACQNAGKRLCTDSEWLQACAGSEGRRFPYGNEEVPGQCNYGKTHPDVETAEKPVAKYKLTSPEVNKVYDLASTGKYNQCVTPEGVFDMTGNLQEWVNDGNAAAPNKFGGGYYGAPLCSGGVCVVQEPAKDNRGCGFQIVGHPATHWDYSLGFRCCAKLS